MTNVLQAPTVTTNRAHARRFLAGLPLDLSDGSVTVKFEDRTIATPSFVDEIIHDLLVSRGAHLVRLENLNEGMCNVALAAADDFGFGDRLLCE